MSYVIPVGSKTTSRSDKIQIPLTLKYDGIFDLDNFYKMVQQWIVDQGFYFEEGTFKHKVPSPAGAEQDYDLSGWQNISEYVRFTIRVYIKTYNLKDLEVIKDGKKRKLSKTKMKVRIAGEVVLDYNNRFEKNKFLLGLRSFYHKYILKEDEGVIGGLWWDKLYYMLFKLHSEMKEYLDMESKGNAYYDVWQYG